MTEEMTIEQQNEMIARFMEVERDVNTWRHPYGATVYLIGGYWLPAKKLKYHSSWEWLMPVVEKTESIQMDKHGFFGVHIHSNACTIQGTKFRSELRDEVYYFDIYSDTKINATWQAIYQFIVWYNTQTQKA